MLQKPTPIPEQKAPVIVRTELLKKVYLMRGGCCTRTEDQMECGSGTRVRLPHEIHEGLLKSLVGRDFIMWSVS